MKKLVNKRFIFTAVGVFLFAAALFLNFNASKPEQAQANNGLATVMLTASAQNEGYKGLAKYNGQIFDCFCEVDGCQKCDCGC